MPKNPEKDQDSENKEAQRDDNDHVDETVLDVPDRAANSQLLVEYRRLIDEHSPPSQEKVLCFDSKATASSSVLGSLGGILSTSIVFSLGKQTSLSQFSGYAASSVFTGSLIGIGLNLAKILATCDESKTFFSKGPILSNSIAATLSGMGTYCVKMIALSSGCTETQANIISISVSTAVTVLPAIAYNLARNCHHLFHRSNNKGSAPVRAEAQIAPIPSRPASQR